MNAANEIAVAAFIRGAIPFYGIAELVERAVKHFAAEFRHAPEDVIYSRAQPLGPGCPSPTTLRKG
jgi:1-deoxy-D-xylulose 5-phosphate reductoisomerase